MYNRLMKKFLIGIIIVIFAVILFNGFFAIQRAFFPAFEIGQENYNKLFEYCSTPISVDAYPNIASDLAITKKNHKELLYDILDNTTEAYIKETKLFALLGDKVEKNNKSSFKINFYGANKDISLFYNYKGNLMVVEKGSNINTQGEFKFYHCKYTSKGNLIEAIFSDKNHETHFNSEKKMIYSVFFSHFGVGVSDNYAKYIIN